MKACWRACGLSSEPTPSIVVISLVVTALTGVTQERTALPSTSTVQAPHCASPQPNFAPLSSRSLRSTYSNGVSGSAGTERLTPLTLRLMAMLGVSHSPPTAPFLFRPVLFCADAGAASRPLWSCETEATNQLPFELLVRLPPRATKAIRRPAPTFRAQRRGNPRTFRPQSPFACRPSMLGNRRG